jgi:hypothetical protein
VNKPGLMGRVALVSNRESEPSVSRLQTGKPQ